MENNDVVLVVGANDVVNSAAQAGWRVTVTTSLHLILMPNKSEIRKLQDVQWGGTCLCQFQLIHFGLGPCGLCEATPLGGD